MRFGNDKKKGCTLGTECESYRSKHCKSSLSQRHFCLVHLLGTQSFKSTDFLSHKKDPRTQRVLSQSIYKRYNKTPGVSQAKIHEMTSNNSKCKSFSEIKDLLESLKGNFQKELSSLRSLIAFQDTRIRALNP